jgi:peptide/nickel transport system permease protein
MSAASPPTNLRAWLTAEVTTSPRQASLQRFYFGWLRLRANPLALLGLAILLALIVVAILAPVIAPIGYNDQSLVRRLQPPSAEHWFGTDELGRDVFSRIVWGSRITLYISSLVAVIAAPIGLAVGTTAGYFGGWTDTVLMRINDVFLSFPSLILALGFVAALGPGIGNAVIAISLTAWPAIARLARAETLTVRHADYIAAVRIQGASPLRIILRHIVPMCVPSVVVRITLNMAGIILTAAGLGFLGLGAQPPTPEWGAMLSTGRQNMLGAWWLAAMPGFAILLTSLAFNLFGDGLRDVLDPRSE